MSCSMHLIIVLNELNASWVNLSKLRDLLLFKLMIDNTDKALITHGNKRLILTRSIRRYRLGSDNFFLESLNLGTHCILLSLIWAEG